MKITDREERSVEAELREVVDVTPKANLISVCLWDLKSCLYIRIVLVCVSVLELEKCPPSLQNLMNSDYF